MTGQGGPAWGRGGADANRKKSSGICRSDTKKSLCGSGTGALQLVRKLPPSLRAEGCSKSNLLPAALSQPILSGFLNSRSTERSKGGNLLKSCRAPVPLPHKLCLVSLRQIPEDFFPTASAPPRPHTGPRYPGTFGGIFHAVPGNVRWNFVPSIPSIRTIRTIMNTIMENKHSEGFIMTCSDRLRTPLNLHLTSYCVSCLFLSLSLGLPSGA